VTPEQLIAFEDDIWSEFAAGRIPYPVHFAGGNETQLIEAFRDVGPNDYVLCSWRSHYHALLKGVPPAEVKRAIMEGRSIALCFPDYRILSSAIVGGICPIAVGLAWGIKAKGGKEKVHAFIGDMTARTGIYQECRQYCMGHALPVRWIIEDNGKSVVTDTVKAWGDRRSFPNVTTYTYKLTKPHVGIGKWVSF
jgi:TPP-dependent pyruvate/acetoin dehydrogenase alpha subunit